MNIELDVGEFVVSKIRKRPLFLFFGLLFNRIAPGFLLFPMLIYSMVRPKEMVSAISSENSWLIVLFFLIVALGIVGQSIIVYDFFTKTIAITNQRVLIIKQKSIVSYEFSKILSHESRDGFFASALTLKFDDQNIVVLDYLDPSSVGEFESELLKCKTTK